MSREAFEKYKTEMNKRLVDLGAYESATKFARDVDPRTFKAGYEAGLTKAPVVAEWISVDDRLPECSNGHVWSAPAIVQCDLGIIYKLSYFSGDGDDGCWQRTTNFVDNGSNRIVEWMPLPPAKDK